ncbi:CinA family nicotinamide mononucleotide deamidase-related protein [Horticoccus luteus]|uniref:CinA-like protein n=1 Tax=Horticoccus luteus TaxID=2862869 RepID=A0A8F9TVT0_9BACT|nr:CinA family nicotinamide mononucleotide deamidase-related protein [Horticoccus luteus]QYM78906.1 CinA family nicotinamide mononucleotide deamidase-related protein [Horticoccus luteus]
MVSSSSANHPLKPVSQLHYELLTLGDELLLGLTPNSHLTYIGAQLGRRGVLLRRSVTITDEADAIARQFRESWAQADVIITTGGLGPTCDDRTREVLAEVLGQALVYDAAIEQAIIERFARLGKKMTANNLKQAFRFERGEVLANPNGTAPGLWVEQDGKVLCMLPGPPNELQPMLTEQVIPRLAERGLLASREAYLQLRTAGIGESMLEIRLEPILQRHQEALSVAFCAHHGHVDCRLSSPTGALSEAQLLALGRECEQLLGEDFVTFGQDSIAKVCGEALRAQEKTLAVAETSTSGLLAQAFGDLCGAGKFFAGGVICCSNDSKMQLLDVPECLMMQHGAVSAECAVALATGAAEKLGADYALAITGFGGKCGGPKENPAGMIFVALYSPHGVWSKSLNFPGPRAVVNVRAVNTALDWLRRELMRAAREQSSPQRRSGVMQ